MCSQKVTDKSSDLLCGVKMNIGNFNTKIPASAGIFYLFLFCGITIQTKQH